MVRHVGFEDGDHVIVCGVEGTFLLLASSGHQSLDVHGLVSLVFPIEGILPPPVAPVARNRHKNRLLCLNAAELAEILGGDLNGARESSTAEIQFLRAWGALEILVNSSQEVRELAVTRSRFDKKFGPRSEGTRSAAYPGEEAPDSPTVPPVRRWRAGGVRGAKTSRCGSGARHAPLLPDGGNRPAPRAHPRLRA